MQGSTLKYFRRVLCHTGMLLCCLAVSVHAQDRDSLRFLVIGDWGTAGKGQRKVAAGMAAEHRRDPVDLVVSVGDNFYPSGVKSTDDRQWKGTFEDVYRRENLPVPFWAVLGNHDYRSSPQAQVDYTGKRLADGAVTRWHMPSRQWVHDMRSPDGKVSVRLIGIDTPQIVGSASGRKTCLAWLDSVLQATTADRVFVFGHHQVYSYGHYGNGTILIRHLAPLLERYGVDAYFHGHEHDMQMVGPVGGVYYVVSGAAAGPRKTHLGPRSLFASGSLGFVSVTAGVSGTTVTFHDAQGNVLFSHTIRKEQPPRH
jgi:acid phosphatase